MKNDFDLIITNKTGEDEIIGEISSELQILDDRLVSRMTVQLNHQSLTLNLTLTRKQLLQYLLMIEDEALLDGDSVH